MGYSLGLIARSQADIEKASRKICEQFPEVKVIAAAFDVVDDVNSEDFIRRVCSELGSISVLVNNAGFYKPGTSSIPLEDVKRSIDVNFLAAVRFVQAVVPSMKKLVAGTFLI